MTNKELFNLMHNEQWVIEENLCFMLQEYWEQARKKDKSLSGMPINPVGFVKQFMKDETIVDTVWAERCILEKLHEHPENIIDIEVKE